MKWYWLNFLAIIRGLMWKWPDMPSAPRGHTSTSCGFSNWREARTMHKHGWVPYCVQKTGLMGATISRLFTHKMDEEDLFFEREWIRHEEEMKR